MTAAQERRHRPYCPLARQGLTKSERKALPCLCGARVRKLGDGLYRFTTRKGP